MKNEINRLMPAELMVIARVTSAALVIFNARLFTLLGMLLCAAAFGYVMWQPDWIRFAGACAFAALVYLPVVRMENSRVTEEAKDE